ncbi:MAG: hypothetical protein OEY00_02240 [Gammaproteobacteria bacterium]|nr:hypothetical protein [Gammaproteobacteria bacterium]
MDAGLQLREFLTSLFGGVMFFDFAHYLACFCPEYFDGLISHEFILDPFQESLFGNQPGNAEIV